MQADTVPTQADSTVQLPMRMLEKPVTLHIEFNTFDFLVVVVVVKYVEQLENVTRQKDHVLDGGG